MHVFRHVADHVLLRFEDLILDIGIDLHRKDIETSLHFSFAQVM